MKHLLLILLLVAAPKGHSQTAPVDIEEQIRGNWVLEKTKTGETADTSIKMTVYFKSNNTGNFNLPDKDSEPFTWTMTRNKVTIVYEGKEETCKAFTGDFKVLIRDRKGVQNMSLIRSGFSVSFTR